MSERLAKKLLRVTLECTVKRIRSEGDPFADVTDMEVQQHWDDASGNFKREALALADCAI